MRRLHIQSAAAALALIGLLSGCASDEGTTFEKSRHSTPAKSTASSKLPKNGAPPVTEPLDATLIEKNPCNAMTKQQARSFKGELTSVTTNATGGKAPACVWEYDGDRYPYGTISGWLGKDYKHGLSSVYGAMNDPSSTISPIEQIGGHPAVRQLIGFKDAGSCGIIVGLSNDLVYVASTQIGSSHPRQEEPCKVARKLAGYVVQNLKEAQ